MSTSSKVHNLKSNIQHSTFLLLSLGIALATTSLVPSPAAANLARIISIDGEVQLQRDGWRSFQRALPGTALYGRDFLQPARGSRVLVICPYSRAQWSVPSGTISAVNNGCPNTPHRVRPQFGVGDLTGGSNPMIPYVMTPRDGWVLNSHPTLRWNPVDEAERYIVTLVAQNEPLWQIETELSSIPYPDGEPELVPDRRYSLRVETNTGVSSMNEEQPLSFSLLVGDEADAAQVEIDLINRLNVSEQVRTLILVEEIYPKYQLTAAAIHDLEALVSSGVETAQVHRLLGDLYLKSGLRLLAENHYGAAIDIATQGNEVEERVLAQLGLGTLYRQVGEAEQAAQQLRYAQEGASELEDERLMDSIRGALDEL